MSYTPGPPEDDNYAPLTPEQVEAALDAIDQMQRPWWQRLAAYPCFVALALVQVVQRRWAEWRGR